VRLVELPAQLPDGSTQALQFGALFVSQLYAPIPRLIGLNHGRCFAVSRPAPARRAPLCPLGPGDQLRGKTPLGGGRGRAAGTAAPMRGLAPLPARAPEARESRARAPLPAVAPAPREVPLAPLPWARSWCSAAERASVNSSSPFSVPEPALESPRRPPCGWSACPAAARAELPVRRTWRPASGAASLARRRTDLMLDSAHQALTDCRAWTIIEPTG
jgi:hypothetical protein